ncbi:MAG: hypothetical protein IBX62_10075 [Coriobacteriia bacterium]|nr:hypothetical protein [Coriobacteriia bacterium]
MTQGGERREKKAFEPPPWERERFERLGRRAEQERRTEAEPGAAAPAAPVRQQPAAARTGPAETVPAAEAGGGRRGDADALFEILRAEEGLDRIRTDTLSTWGGLTVGIFGVVMIVWAAVGAARGGGRPLALALAVTLLCVGGLFTAAGVWLAGKGLKRQGVL